MGMSTNQPRRPAGAPTGGQWAPAQHDEADIDLLASPTLGEMLADNANSAKFVRELAATIDAPAVAARALHGLSTKKGDADPVGHLRRSLTSLRHKRGDPPKSQP